MIRSTVLIISIRYNWNITSKLINVIIYEKNFIVNLKTTTANIIAIVIVKLCKDDCCMVLFVIWPLICFLPPSQPFQWRFWVSCSTNLLQHGRAQCCPHYHSGGRWRVIFALVGILTRWHCIDTVKFVMWGRGKATKPVVNAGSCGPLSRNVLWMLMRRCRCGSSRNLM